MATLKLKITGPVALGGKQPGDVFELPAEDGIPLDLYWRRRLEDEKNFGGGHVTVVAPAAPAAEVTPSADEPSLDAKASPATKKKG